MHAVNRIERAAIGPGLAGAYRGAGRGNERLGVGSWYETIHSTKSFQKLSTAGRPAASLGELTSGMAHFALERARASEDSLAKLRAELRDLEDSESMRLPADAHLTTSVDDLARLHEQHASTMREFGRVLRNEVPSSYPTSAAMAPLPSEEPDMFGLTGRRLCGGTSNYLSSSSPALPQRPDFARPLVGGARPSDIPLTDAAPANRPPRGPATSVESMPMQRSGLARREAVNAATERAQAAASARYAREAAARREAAEQAAARNEAARERATQRSGYVVTRSSAELPEGLMAASGSGGMSARAATGSGIGGRGPTVQQLLAASATAPLPIRPVAPRPSSAPRERPRITVPTPFSFEHRDGAKREHERKRQMEAEQKNELQVLEESRKENRARPVPATTAPGLYEKQVQEMEEKSKERRATRKTVPVPFSFTSRSERKAGANLDDELDTPRSAFAGYEVRRRLRSAPSTGAAHTRLARRGAPMPPSRRVCPAPRTARACDGGEGSRPTGRACIRTWECASRSPLATYRARCRSLGGR